MDFITGLAPYKTRKERVIDSILVVMDRFTKYIWYFAVSTTINLPDLIELIYRKFVCRFSILQSFITDRGTVFTSGFWSAFTCYLCIKRRLSTTFYA